MKKILFAVASLAALFSCAKEEQAPVQNAEPFRIEANFNADTKTTFNPVDYSVEWEETDELSVLINDGTSTKLYKFTKVADAANAFECADFVPAAGVDYTYNVLYPYSSYAKDIDADGYCTGYIELPSKGNANLTQSALNDAAHVKGTLYAQASAAGTEAPVVNMVHLTHILKAKITNKTAADLKISGVSVTNDADVALAGDYFVNFTTGDFKLKSGSALKTTSVSVSGTLAAGETGFVYIVTPAFTIPATKSLTFTVTCEGGSAEIVKTMESELVCEAGTVSTANIEVTSIVPEEEPITIPDGDYWMIADGKVATSLAESGDYGYLPVEDVVEDASTAVNAYTFTHTEDGKYTIQDCYGRYLYMKGTFTSFNVSSTLDSENNTYYWKLYKSDDKYIVKNFGNKNYIQYSKTYNSYGSYPTEQSNAVLPILVAATNPVTPTALSTPSNIVTSEVTDKSITLSWDVVANAGGYMVSYDKAGIMTSVNTQTNSAVITGLAAETEYTFFIIATSNASAWRDSEAATKTETTLKATDNDNENTEKKYVKVTSALTDWSGQYLIVYEEGQLAFDGSLTTFDKVGNIKDVTIVDGEIMSNDEVDAFSFTIAASVDGYSIKGTSGKYAGNKSNSNALTSSDSELINTISLDADGNANIVGEGGAYLRYNAASNQTRFRYYKSASYTNQKPIALYKLN